MQGGLREDSLQRRLRVARRALLGLRQICAKHAQRLVAAPRSAGSGYLAAQSTTCWRKKRPGATPLRLDLLRTGAAGMLDLNGTSSVRVDADLPGALRAMPGVRAVKLTLSRPGRTDVPFPLPLRERDSSSPPANQYETSTRQSRRALRTVATALRACAS
jgi:DNA polymerase-3 subunit alpha